MRKEYSALLMTAIFAVSMSFISTAKAVEADVEIQTEIDLALSEIDVNSITDAELTEAEPSDVPEVAEDPALTEELSGQMLLDVEGNGEVYYVDPVDGGKEYLADGESAHALLRRRALGINEENFAKLDQGTEKSETSVCRVNELATRLRGRIVLRVDMNGEAWWILPTNCRAYYVGTHEAAYDLMKRFSLGITKENLGKIRNTERQNFKRAVRFSVYAYAQENDVTLEEAREFVKNESQEVRACVKDGGISVDADNTRADVRARIRACHESSNLPVIDRERLLEIKSDIRDARRERMEERREIREIRIREFRTERKSRTTTSEIM
jgi:hypothetical protein